jgi:hypothetical protein
MNFTLYVHFDIQFEMNYEAICSTCRLLLDTVEEGQDGGHGLIQLRWNLLVQPQMTEDPYQLRIVVNRNIVLPGRAEDLFGPSPLALGNNFRSSIPLRNVT